MNTMHKRAGQAFTMVVLTLTTLVVATPAWARPAPPERLVGDASTGSGVTAPVTQAGSGTSVWLVVLVAVLAAVLTLALAAAANRTVVHRRLAH